ncbi:MAG: hypothetical protein ABSH01_10870 [Terriglobia bacterium]|jgi:hypothetical protein
MANTPIVRRQQSKSTASGVGRPTARLRPQNRKLLKWLDSWLATPDDRGEKWWNGFEDDLRNHRTTFRPTQTG